MESSPIAKIDLRRGLRPVPNLSRRSHSSWYVAYKRFGSRPYFCFFSLNRRGSKILLWHLIIVNYIKPFDSFIPKSYITIGEWESKSSGDAMLVWSTIYSSERPIIIGSSKSKTFSSTQSSGTSMSIATKLPNSNGYIKQIHYIIINNISL